MVGFDQSKKGRNFLKNHGGKDTNMKEKDVQEKICPKKFMCKEKGKECAWKRMCKEKDKQGKGCATKGNINPDKRIPCKLISSEKFQARES